ncbi:hypothetical protein EDC96DRAFT_512590 [Choanephora cucurbitarum]|nr:hypothetical protein EDC96DRAFT_512590 [Choanephora cucurbitarum]
MKRHLKQMPSDHASQAILDLVKEKQREVEETLKMRQLSADMVKKLHLLSQGIQALTENASSVRKTLENWDNVFNTMAELNLQEGKHNSTWVRFDKTS